MGRLSCVMLGLAASLAVATPGWAQGAGREDGNVTFLRRTHYCLILIGAYVALTKPEFSPAPADVALMDEILPLSDRLVYEAETLAGTVGPEAAKKVDVQVNETLQQELAATRGLPDRTTVLRARFAPGLRDCVEHGQRLANPPPGWKP